MTKNRSLKEGMLTDAKYVGGQELLLEGFSFAEFVSEIWRTEGRYQG